MKKIVLIIVMLLMGFGVNLYLRSQSAATPLVSPSATTPTTPMLSPTSTTVSKPKLLEIPSIKVKANVEFVGLDAKKNMDVPKDPDNVGWFELGFVPGTTGSAVIAGHLDTKTSPAVFAHLASVKPGDEVIIHTEAGTTQTFIVEKIQQFTYDKLPLKEIFGESTEKRLNLITCTGTFDYGKENYSHRTVVYTKLQE